MGTVFISYSHKDEKVASEIVAVLSEHGIDPFQYATDIAWGNRITKEVRAALEECKALLVIISPASLKSQWVPYEIGHSVALRKIILPFLTHPSLDVPHYVSDLNYKSTLDEVRNYFVNKFPQEVLAVPQSVQQASAHAEPDLSVEAKELLVNTAEDPSGHLKKIRNRGGMIVQTNGREFCETGNARSQATWESAIADLLAIGLLEDPGGKGEGFRLTNEGYRIADLLRAGP